MAAKKKENRGGNRAGAGRKPGPEKKSVTLRLPAMLAEKVNALEKKNQVAEKIWQAYFSGLT